MPSASASKPSPLDLVNLQSTLLTDSRTLTNPNSLDQHINVAPSSSGLACPPALTSTVHAVSETSKLPITPPIAPAVPHPSKSLTQPAVDKVSFQELNTPAEGPAQVNDSDQPVHSPPARSVDVETMGTATEGDETTGTATEGDVAGPAGASDSDGLMLSPPEKAVDGETADKDRNHPESRMEVETPTNPMVGVDTCSALPSWATAILDYLRDISVEPQWQELVNHWVMFEGMNPSIGVSFRVHILTLSILIFWVQKLATLSRPEEVAWWIKRAKATKAIPKVMASEFSVGWQKWWSALQPDWRDNPMGGWPLLRDIPDDETWAMLATGGPIGLVTVIMTLSWWLPVLQSDSDHEVFWSSVDDVNWILAQIVKGLELDQHSNKRAASTEPDDPPSAKRSVFDFMSPYVLLTCLTGHVDLVEPYELHVDWTLDCYYIIIIRY